MKMLSAAVAASRAQPGDSIYLGGCTAEPTAILRAVESECSLWKDIHLYGTFIPGVNTLDYASIGQLAKVSSLFPTHALRHSEQAEKLHIQPLTYYQWSHYLQNQAEIDIAYFQVSPPDASGRVSLGFTVDFIPALVSTRCKFIGVINDHIPFLPNSVLLPTDRFEAFVEDDTPLLELINHQPDDVLLGVAQQVKSLLREGDCLQLGLGNFQQALLASLTEFRDLGLHGGMVSNSVPDLMQRGVFRRGVTAGVALGDTRLYANTPQLAKIEFKPVSYTHDVNVLAKIEQFVSINSILEVDLQGNVNAEYLSGHQVSALGGLPDFINGANRAAGGRVILTLSSTTRDGKTSRVVQRIPSDSAIPIAPALIHFVVTEYGVADLREVKGAKRAERIVAIAHPDFRDSLSKNQ